jgi:hypothetical protein
MESTRIKPMLTFPNQLGSQQNQINHFLHQLTQLYQDAKLERFQAARTYPGSEDGFSIVEELELLTVDISGYATQIQATGQVKNVENAIVDLRRFNVFENSIVIQFYQVEGQDYPKLQSYIQLLDYLRLLSLEYLQQHQPQYSIPA